MGTAEGSTWVAALGCAGGIVAGCSMSPFVGGTYTPRGLAVVLVVCCGYGYLLGRLHAARIRAQQERERAVDALARAPDWELKARTLEDEANRLDLQGWSYTAVRMREAADRARRLGRERGR